MNHGDEFVRLSNMNGQTRGQAVRRRRLANGMSVRALSVYSGVDRKTIDRAENDEATVSELTYVKLESALNAFATETTSDWEESAGAQTEPASDAIVEFEVRGDFGVSIVTRGPVSDLDKLEASVARLIREMRNESGTSQAKD